MIDTYLATAAINFASLLVLAGFLYNNHSLVDQRKKPFLLGILLTALIFLAEAGTIMAAPEVADLRSLNVLCNVLGFALSPLIPIVLAAIFDMQTLRRHLFLLIPSVLNAALAILSPWFDLTFHVDGGNQYHRGPVFFIFVAVYVVNILILAIIVRMTGKRHLHLIQGKIIALALFTIVGTSIQVLFPAIYVSWHCVTVAIFLYYILLTEFDGSFDVLTGLFNRAAFDKTIKRIARRKHFSVIVMDINAFKGINDTYGHDYGDTVLKKIASILREVFCERSNCYRIGGDEFYVICKDCDWNGLESRLKKVTERLTEERVKDKRLPTIAYGYSIYDKDQSMDARQVLIQADEQMYYFKKQQKAMNS